MKNLMEGLKILLAILLFIVAVIFFILLAIGVYVCKWIVEQAKDSDMVYFLRKLWHGECSECQEMLVEVEGYPRSECPKCKTRYYTGF